MSLSFPLSNLSDSIGALSEVHGGAYERAVCLGDSYRLGRGTDCRGYEIFWQVIFHDCCSVKVWFNLFYKLFVSEAEFS